MNILFLSVTDQHAHSMGRYVDLNRTYDFNNWVEGFSTLAYEFHLFDYYKSFVRYGPSATERSIIELIEQFSINIIILPIIYYEIGAFFLQNLRKWNVRSLLVFFDDSSRFESTSRFYVGLCDFVVTHESKNALRFYQPYHCNVSFFPCYPSVKFYDKLLNSTNRRLTDLGDVSFVGAKIADRALYLDKLSDCGLALSVYGAGWPRGRVTQMEMLAIFRQSKISLNFTKSGMQVLNKQLKARAFEIVLAGGFLLTEYDEELCEYFKVGEEIDIFQSFDECVLKIDYYLKNPDIRLEMQKRAELKCRTALNFETAWSAYFNNLDSSFTTNQFPSRDLLPLAAVNAFIEWNMDIIYARFRIKQQSLAIDQVGYCLRELNYFSNVYSLRIWLLLCVQLIQWPVRKAKLALRRLIRL